MIVVTATAPVNIAVIKYWGKREEKLILPVNGSISVTLNSDQLRAKTTIAASPSFECDRIWLNGKEEPISNERLQTVLKEIRRRARKRKQSAEGDLVSEKGVVACEQKNGVIEGEEMINWKVHICSENNFPTAAGLASSAAGYACLVYTLAKVYSVEGDVSDIARQGSGSACRSMYGGFVEWVLGEKMDGSDSIARQLEPAQHWPDLKVLILVVSGTKKHTPSTVAMLNTVKTSRLMDHRINQLVPQSLINMRAAIKNRDFQAFAEITMRDSNQMHAACLDAYPPVVYLTDISHDIIRLVHSINSFYNSAKVCYTFDAGPNACLYLPQENVPLVLGLIEHFFSPPSSKSDFVTGLEATTSQPSEELLRTIPLTPNPGAIRYIIHTKIGMGPQVLDDKTESLLDEKGYPLELLQS